jgi:hypothetical protein
MLEDLDLHSIADDRARELIRHLLNLLEDVTADLRAAQAEIQRLRDELNRIKGEQGQPTSKANPPPPPPKDHTSAQERRTSQAWVKGRKTARIPIDREQVAQVDPDCLPPDAVCKGYEDVVVQDVIFRTDNIGVCVAMERKPGKCMLRILVIGIPERTQTTLRHRL